MRTNGWATRIGYLALIAAVLGAGLLFTGATMVRYAMGGSKMAGFSYIPNGAYLVAGGLVLAIIAVIWRAISKRGKFGPALWALIIAGVPVVWLAVMILPNRDVPAIHDVTTDLNNPPAFSALTLSEDNLRGLESEQEWRALHEGAYNDIQPVVVAAGVEDVIRKAAEIADRNGWVIAASVPAEGRMEATDTVSYYKFEDDIVVRATPSGDAATRVDVRSVSRVGVSDLGYNARRIRALLADLQEAFGEAAPEPAPDAPEAPAE